MWHLLLVTLVLSLLGGCSVAGVVSGPGPAWDCAPIDPLWQELPANPCFRAVLSAENEITLQWRVVKSQPLAYIYDDFGPDYRDIGFKHAACPSVPHGNCSSSITVTESGLHRWLIEVTHPGGKKVNVPASITVPPTSPPTVTGGGFVDILAPTNRTISWLADPRNAALDQTTETAWIELLPPRSWWQRPQRLARAGPEATFTVPKSEVSKQGQAVYSVRVCHLRSGSDSKICSQPAVVVFYTDADRFLDPSPLYTISGKDLTISFTNNSGDLRRLFSTSLIPPKNGQAFLETRKSSVTIDADLLTPGAHTIELMSCVSQTNTCSKRSQLQIIVDSAVDWTLEREYTDDFLSGTAHKLLGYGQPLDITYDANGGIWAINEFSNNIEYVSPSGTVESFTIPTARQPLLKDLSFESTRPFASNMTGKNIPVNFSALGERATLLGSKIWFTQGGGMLGPTTEIKNHSRVISFDPSLSDSPATPYDDRLCVYNIPSDDADRPANNLVIGLTGAGNRIWIGEGRAFLGPEPSAISSFIPDPNSCENLLNFEDPQALTKQRLQYCKPGSTPEQDGCIELILLDGPLSKIKVAHLETDPIDDTVWFTDTTGRFLGHLDPEREEVIVAYPIPDPHAGRLLGGFPWSLRVDNDAVYFGEYSTSNILRFDKATATFDEILVPIATNQVALHSIDLDPATDRLWFTLSNDNKVPLDRTASTIGYIDLSSWREHIAHPEENARISGTIYKGLDKIGASTANADQHQSFRGIAVDPASGKIALASTWRNQIIELTPNGSFWP